MPSDHPASDLLKYPRTPHLAGSRLQPDDSAADQVPLARLAHSHVLIEEKLDGANTAISFNAAGELQLQSRGHYLTGGGSERQFNLFKLWARAHEARLLALLEDRYVLYGEWLYAKHSVFYDRLPHYFHEFDVLDRRTGRFLSTARRRQLLADSPVLSVPVLYEGEMPTRAAWLWKLVVRSLAKTRAWRDGFEATVAREGLPLPLCWQQTDTSDCAEGLYLKVEDEEQVLGRYKLVRSDFVQTILDSGSHHSRRPVLPNLLDTAVDLYAPVPTLRWSDLGLRTVRSLKALQALTPAQLEGDRP